ncbi:MAG: inositol monophosphatase [Bacteroidetes bacterium]|nr:inositol monophosphatase [Bacteroidota bacterium]MCW5893969.1 inositol monophosphatase [Bacteroidota bacterium]
MLTIAIEAAKEAGKFLKYNVGRVKNIEMKKGEERNLVSEIDKGSEERIIGIIKRHYPNHAILAEESGASPDLSGSDYKWVIDPLDGTTNFLHGLPIFCVTIGIEYKGEIVAGVVYDPNLEELFTAEKGSGAFLNGKRLRVTSSTTLIDSLLVTGFPYDIAENPDNAIGHFVNFLMEARGIRRLGSAALDLSYVAAGRFDGFWEVNLNPWDMAAGILFVREAGGRVTDFAGNESTIYNKQVLATNGIIHDAMLAVLSKGFSR